MFPGDLYEVPRHYDHNFAGRGGLFDSGISPDVVARSVPDVEEKTPLASTHSLKSRSTPSISSIGLQVDSAHKTAAGGGDSSMPVLPSLSRQTTELNSPQLGRRGLPNSISDTRLGLANMSDVLAGSSEYSSRAVSPRSASLISSSGAAIVKAERVMLSWLCSKVLTVLHCLNTFITERGRSLLEVPCAFIVTRPSVCVCVSLSVCL